MMASTLPLDNTGKSPRTGGFFGHWIPWVFVGLFLLVLAANSTMIVIAVSTFTGLETTNAYEKGLNYNNRLAAAAEQESLGWKADLVVTTLGHQRAVLVLQLNDRLGSPITSAEVEAALLRPVREGHDLTAHLDHQGKGRYRAEVALPLPGQWDVQLTANARQKTYRLAERIHIGP
ncbi:MAG: FixH family protein [Geminicoccaceae bacterium]